ncbi:MAG: hypothetical protein ACRCXM_14275, partial [Beijerinckiaceae bacterium]
MKTVFGPGGQPHDFPDDMSDDDMIAVMKKTYGGSTSDRGTSIAEVEQRQASLNPDHGGLSADEIKRFEGKRRFEGPNQRRGYLGMTIGAGDEISAAADTATDLFRPSFWSGRETLGDRWDSNMRVQGRLNEIARRDGSIIPEIAGGIGGAFLAPIAGPFKAAASTVPQAVGRIPGAMQGLRSFMTPAGAGNAAVLGAGFGAAQGFADTDGGVIDRAAAIPGQAALGTLGAIGLGGALSAGIGSMAGRNAAKAQAAGQRAATADEWTKAGVEPFGPAITDSSVASRTAEGLAGNWLGAPLRERASQAIDETTAAAQGAIRSVTGGGAPVDLAADLQGTLRRNLKSHSRSPDEIAAMSNDDLERQFTGRVTDQGFGTPRPQVDPVAPRDVEPVAPRYDRFPAASEMVDIPQSRPKVTSFDDVHPPPRMMQQRDEVAREMASMNRRYGELEPKRQQLQAELDQVMRNRTGTGLVEEVYEATVGTPAMRAAREQLSKVDNEIASLKQGYARYKSTLGQIDEQISRAREAQWKHLNTSEAERVASSNASVRSSAQERASRARAEREAAEETVRLREQATRDAQRETSARQAAAEQAWSENPTSGSFRFGRTKDSYPTEANAAYTRLENEIPGERFNPLGDVYRGNTETRRMLDDIFTSARSQLKMPGTSKLFRDDGQFHPEFVSL